MSITPQYPTECDIELEITPVAKHNWKTGESRDRWKEHLNTCRDYFPLVEMASTARLSHPREVAQINRARLRDETYIDVIVEHDLTVKTSHDTAYVAPTDAQAEEAVQAAEDDDGRRLAELYGYPECCIDTFEERDQATHRTPLYEIACNSDNAVARDEENQEILIEDPSPILNPIWQYLGYTFLPHLPCSFDCDDSYDIGRLHGEIFRDLDCGEAAEHLWEFLGVPTTWSGYHGLSNIKNGYLIGSTNTPEYWDDKTVVFAEDHAEKL